MNKDQVLDEINLGNTSKGKIWLWTFFSVLILTSFFSIHTFSRLVFFRLDRFRVLDLYQTFTDIFFILALGGKMFNDYQGFDACCKMLIISFLQT